MLVIICAVCELQIMDTPFNRMNVDFIEDSKKRQIKTVVNVYSA